MVREIEGEVGARRLELISEWQILGVEHAKAVLDDELFDLLGLRTEAFCAALAGQK